VAKGIVFEQSESTPLAFDSHDDAINYAKEVVEEFNSGFLEYNAIDIVEAYRRVKLDIVVRGLAPIRDHGDWEYVFHACPVGLGHENGGPARFISDLSSEASGPDEVLMLVYVRELVQTPQGFIPSLVRLERGHKVKDFLVDVFGSMCSTSFDLSGALAEREVSVPSRPPRSDSNRESQLIERAPEILDGIQREARNTQGQGLDELDVVPMVRSVWLSNDGVRITLKEGFSQNLNLVDVRLGVIDGQARVA
jgi:hypothetical protein